MARKHRLARQNQRLRSQIGHDLLAHWNFGRVFPSKLAVSHSVSDKIQIYHSMGTGISGVQQKFQRNF